MEKLRFSPRTPTSETVCVAARPPSYNFTSLGLCVLVCTLG